MSPQSSTSWFGTTVQLCHWQGLTTQLSTPTAFQARLKIIYFILKMNVLPWKWENKKHTAVYSEVRVSAALFGCILSTAETAVLLKNSRCKKKTQTLQSKGIQCSRRHFTNKILTSNQKDRHHNLKPIQV